jgi:hypothetical protein
MKDFVGAVLGQPSPERRRRRRPPRPERAQPQPLPPQPPVDPRRQLPCDLYLTMGASSVRAFAAGPIDEFAFFQRYGVSDRHDTEFLTRLDATDRGTENFKGWGLFRLGSESQPLAALESDQGLRQRLKSYGLERLPLARQMFEGGLTAYDPRRDEHLLAGRNRLEPPSSSKTFKKVGERRYSYRDVLEILRQELTGPQTVAWIEATLPPPPPLSPIVHRYYLDTHKQAYLVRDRRDAPKQLFLAETSDEALEAILASGRQVRRFSRRRP